MGHLKLIILFILVITNVNVIQGQVITGLNSNVLNGGYVSSHIPTKRVVQYSYLREADVMWSKRVWRSIDLREKQNHPLFYPLKPLSDRICLFDVMKYGILEEGSLTLYETAGIEDDQFRFPVKKASGESDTSFQKRLLSYFGEVSLQPSIDMQTGLAKYDSQGNPEYEEIVSEYENQEVIRFEIKEDWFFDKQRSVMDVRIIGIAPIVMAKDPSGQVIGSKTLFWLYFPECRYVFQNFFVYNPHNDAQRMSFDDLFWKRDFNSYIHKESNIYDRTVSPNWKGVDALLESDKIKGEMFKIEHDFWNL